MPRILFAVIVFLVSFLPVSAQRSQTTLNFGDMATLLSSAHAQECVAALSPRALQLTWTGACGSSDSLKVALTLQESSLSLPDGCTPRLEARLEMPEVTFEPFGTQNRTLTAAATRFEWQIRPPAPAEYRGTLWLYLLPADGTRLPVYTHPLTLRVWAWLTPLRWLLRLLAGLLLVKLPLFKNKLE